MARKTRAGKQKGAVGSAQTAEASIGRFLRTAMPSSSPQPSAMASLFRSVAKTSIGRFSSHDPVLHDRTAIARSYSDRSIVRRSHDRTAITRSHGDRTIARRSARSHGDRTIGRRSHDRTAIAVLYHGSQTSEHRPAMHMRRQNFNPVRLSHFSRFSFASLSLSLLSRSR